MDHLPPGLLQALRHRLTTTLDLERWDEAASHIARFLAGLPEVQADGAESDGVRSEQVAFVARLREIEPSKRVHLYNALGDRAGQVRALIEGAG